MKNNKCCSYTIDKDYIIKIRREIHMYPELEFDLPKTTALVRRELDSMGIPYTERYGKSSIVATMNGDKKGFTIGIRADMDALPITEINDISYKSKNPGKMHACGHDAHTAMLLGAAKALKLIENELSCCVKLIFQASEEGRVSGAKCMVEDGIMDDIDIIIGLHIESLLQAGYVGVYPGDSMASSRIITVEFFGKSAHATLPHSGKDALAMAVRAYQDIYLLTSREIDPFAQYVCSISSLVSDSVHNVIPDYSILKISVRTFDEKLDEHIFNQISKVSNQAAVAFGGQVKVNDVLKAHVVYNDPIISEKIIESAIKVVGEDKIAEVPKKMSSEDFSYFLTNKPGVFFRLGTRNPEKGVVGLVHNSNFMIDEDALPIGSQVFVQFVIDNMKGIDYK